VIAPGKDIEAALSGTTVEVVPMSGTSQAAAHVSGAIALVLSAQEKKRKPNEPRLNAAQIRAALTQTTQTNHYQWNEASGSGLLDVKRLVDAFD
jgi:subtilisin family serine protease